MSDLLAVLIVVAGGMSALGVIAYIVERGA